MKQLFNVDNFFKIYKYENKKGKYIDRVISNKLHKYSNYLLIINKLIKKYKKNNSSSSYTLGRLKSFKDKVIKNKEALLEVELKTIANNINTSNYNFTFNHFKKNGKKIYKLNIDSTNFFLIKKLQYNYKLAFDINQSNKYEITYQLKNILNNNFPKYIIKTDLESFYENIDLKVLKNKISKNNVLSNFSKKMTYKILSEYRSYSKLDNGIPRGIGVSAFLSEIYLQDFDNEMKSSSDVIYYARYVDDIIIIFTPNIITDKYNYFYTLKNLLQKHKVKINTNKTIEYNFTKPTSNQENVKKDYLEFLGYKFYFNNIKNLSNKNKLYIGFSTKKMKRYIIKMQLTFDSYHDESKYNEKKARKNLINRIKFLTGNTKLLNAKKDILIGINFSNEIFNLKHDLRVLDLYLKNQLVNLSCYYKIRKEYGGHVDIDKLRMRLNKYTFLNSWENKSFSKFTFKQIEEIIRIWKNIDAK
ncbi:antiviral reverse transcriptase Drt3a [Arcobacter sp. YIC-464]|uniref:antiviral reverse transcriptase Drt3a n=1 Tax=Arcobacter sp. YIC-464 TaxID=3376631 RepID=UPI003C1874CB